MELQPGTVIGEYIISQELGKGGMGTVCKAVHRLSGWPKALKFIDVRGSADLKIIERIKNEMSIVAMLHHKNIVHMNPPFQFEGHMVQVMDFVEGEPFSNVLKRGRLSLREAVAVARQLSAPIDYIHSMRITHRDLKPENIIVRPDGTLVLIDWGTAIADWLPRCTAPGMSVGTLAYMAPEQLTQRALDGRCDIYALGMLFHEMVAGATAFQGTFEHVCFAILNTPPISLTEFAPDVPEAVCDAVTKALAKNPDERFQSAEAFVDALQGPISEAITPSRRTLVTGVRKLAVHVVTGISVLVLAAALVALMDRKSAAVHATTGARTPPGMQAVTSTPTQLPVSPQRDGPPKIDSLKAASSAAPTERPVRKPAKHSKRKIGKGQPTR